MLKVENLVKRYGERVALAGVSLEIEDGAFYGLLGPNGAGKSTFMNCVTGFTRRDGGTISLAGEPFREDDAPQRRLYGLVPQEIALYDTLTAEENLRVFGELCGVRGRALAARADELLDLVGLTDRADSLVRTFSGGMKRRLNIAASLVHSPRLLYCDEVTVGVDPQSRSAIFTLLENLNRQGVTIVYTTHYMEEAERLCHKTAIIDRGQVLAEGTLPELLSLLPRGRSLRWTPAPSLVGEQFADEAAAFGTVTRDEAGRWVELAPRDNFDAGGFFAKAQRAGLSVWDFTIRRGTLEDVFLSLTGRKLRDN
jgi:ABC-2 type transport system ATP-binding protein